MEKRYSGGRSKPDVITIGSIEDLQDAVRQGEEEVAEAVVLVAGENHSVDGSDWEISDDSEHGKVAKSARSGISYYLSRDLIDAAADLIQRERKRARRVGLVLDED